jgi:hypothetical protein
MIQTRHHARSLRTPRRSAGSRLRIPSSVYRPLLPKLLTVATILWIGWRILAGTAADNLAPFDPAAALSWASDHPAALVRLADQEFYQPPESTKSNSGLSGPDATAAFARRALRAGPLRADALRQLASVAESKGDADKALKLMQLAEKRSLRDLQVQAWLMNDRLAVDDMTGALEHIDTMLRTLPSLQASMFPLIAAFASDPDAQSSVLAFLKRRPPWEAGFTKEFPTHVDNPDILQAFYSDLSTARALTTDELRAYIGRVAELGDYALARQLLVQSLPQSRAERSGNLNNGGFERPIDGLPFSWTLEPVQGAQTEVVLDDQKSAALRVRFYKTHVAYRHVHQLLLLPPGEYRLSGQVKAVALQNERGLQWSISCAPLEQTELATTDLVRGDRPWSTFTVTFHVPSEADCQAQVLRLRLAARVESEEQVSGEIWYDNMQIESLAIKK